MKFSIANLTIDLDIYYKSPDFTVNYESDIFANINRKWFYFLVFCCGGLIYCDDVIEFASEDAKTHFLWLLSQYFDIKTVKHCGEDYLCLK